MGRGAQIDDVRQILIENRLVTLTGAGGAGKTRLAVEVTGRLVAEFGDGVWYVDLAPITGPDLVPVVVGRALGLLDTPGRSMSDAIARFVGERRMLVVTDIDKRHRIDSVVIDHNQCRMPQDN